jgi:hypothetical protein
MRTLLRVLAAAALISTFAAARADEAAPRTAEAGPATLCKDGEHVVLSARVQLYSAQNELGGPEKLVSLCADRAKEPFSALAYRFGDENAADITITATPRSKFLIADVWDGPHSGNNIVWFRRGPYVYYVLQATGQGQGVYVDVFKNGKRITELGTGADDARVLRGAEIDFEHVRSPIFAKKAPSDRLE